MQTLFYLSCMCHYDNYAANESWKEEWALRNPTTNELVKWRGKVLAYDHRNLEFREWWIQRALDMAAHDEIDGIFIDSICKAVHPAFCPPDHEEAYIATANELRERLPEGKLLIGNALRAHMGGDCNMKHMKYLDGSYLEGWQKSNETIATTVQIMSAAAKQGRMIMLVSELEKFMDEEAKEAVDALTTADERYDVVEKYVDFNLGIHLLAVEKYGYFCTRYGMPDANPAKLPVLDPTRFKKVMQKLGEPVGDYVQKTDYIFEREFEHLKLRVNIKVKGAKLTAKEGKEEL